MKIIKAVLLLILITKTTTLLGQNCEIINTNKLLEIGNLYGIDSVLNRTKDLPFYYLDEDVTIKLFDLISKSKNSYELEQFIAGYAYYYRNQESKNVLLKYLELLKSEVPNYVPDKNGDLPEISEEVLNSTIKNSTPTIKASLISIYKLWNQKSLTYESINASSSLESKKSIEVCNLNCSLILLTLKKMKSNFYSKELLKYHEKKLAPYLQGGFSLELDDLSDVLKVKEVEKEIKLSKVYESIGEINIEKEIEFKEFVSSTNSSSCWKILLFQSKKGIMDEGCLHESELGRGGGGNTYRLLLKRNKMFIYKMRNWIT